MIFKWLILFCFDINKGGIIKINYNFFGRTKMHEISAVEVQSITGGRITICGDKVIGGAQTVIINGVKNLFS